MKSKSRDLSKVGYNIYMANKLLKLLFYGRNNIYDPCLFQQKLKTV